MASPNDSGESGARPGEGSGYDRVKVPGPDGQARVLTRSEFEGLPLPERVKHLMGGRLVFYRDGAEVTARDALRTI